MKTRADLHCHGPEEWLNTPRWNPMEIGKLVGKQLDVLAITEMGESDSRFEDLKYAGMEDEKKGFVQIEGNQIYVPRYELIILRTQEIATQNNGKPQGHLIIVGNQAKIPEGSLENVLDNAQNQGAAVVADHAFSGPHPALIGIGYRDGGKKLKELMEQQRIHALEYNGQMDGFNFCKYLLGFYNANKKAGAFADKNKFKIVSNSDGHSAREIPKAYTYLELNDNDLTIERRLADSIINPNSPCLPIRDSAPAFSADFHAGEIFTLNLLKKLGLKENKYFKYH
jgi:hypothetical protein